MWMLLYVWIVRGCLWEGRIGCVEFAWGRCIRDYRETGGDGMDELEIGKGFGSFVELYIFAD